MRASAHYPVALVVAAISSRRPAPFAEWPSIDGTAPTLHWRHRMCPSHRGHAGAFPIQPCQCQVISSRPSHPATCFSAPVRMTRPRLNLHPLYDRRWTRTSLRTSDSNHLEGDCHSPFYPIPPHRGRHCLSVTGRRPGSGPCIRSGSWPLEANRDAGAFLYHPLCWLAACQPLGSRTRTGRPAPG